MEGVSTDSLRALAPKWSLAGDDQLLSLLQNTHQKLISKCQDVNSKLEEMASALDDASINLQNVNNKFMALSNSQFIESRVYEDDADLASDVQPVKESPQKPPVDEITMLKSTLAILERSHETAEILDDSDSDSDVEISVVLKPKDMYAHRPLPYIIGTHQWKNKWHAGLIVEDSDTDSSTSKQDRDIDQYSDSEEEITRPPLEEENTVSESSSSLPGSVENSQPASRPADIAAALAKRLAGDTNSMRVQEEPAEYSPRAHTQVAKVYKPEQPATSAIFSDEPPPLDESTDQSSDEDIFAEINKNTPYTQRNKVQSNLAEDLFSFEKPVESGDIFSDFANTHVERQPVKQKSTLFEEESEPELFAEPTKKEPQNNTVEKDEPSSKKPVGGISLFGSNKGAESIGAAILKRNQRKSSTSGEESGNNDLKIQSDNNTKRKHEKSRTPDRNDQKSIDTTDETDNKSVTKKEKDIFDDLFSKPETKQKTVTAKPVKAKVTPVKENVTAVKEKEKTNIKDLFSDNIFDDIDDIFTSNVKIPTKESNQKSIFDDDDLFSDIDISKSTNQKKDTTESGKDNSVKNVKPSIKSKSIFDSDDELFSDIKTENVSKNIESHAAKVVDKNLDSEVVSKTEAIKKPIETTKERNLFDDSPQIAKSDPKPQIKSKSIFDSDSDDDIFAKIKTDDNKKTDKGKNVLDLSKNINEVLDEVNLFKTDSTNKNNNLLTTDSIKTKEKGIDRSPSLFEEEEIDDLFIAANKLKSKENIEPDTMKVVEENIPPIENEQENLFTSDIVSKTDEVKKTEPVQDIVSTKNDIFGDDEDMVSTKNNIFSDDDDDDSFSKSKEVLVNKPSEKVTHDINPTQEEIKSEVKTPTNAKLNTIAESSVEDTNDTPVKVDLDKTEKPEEVNVKQSVFNDITPVKESNQPKVTAQKENIFDDIFTEPPVFEKPVEPKKSKNVNALFDDDSDDESLFFKKNDVISDEKPEIFLQNANFDIFVNEPPAIDVDFSSKSAENEELDDDLFSNVLKTDKTIKTNVVNEDKDIFSPEQEVVPKLKELDNNEDFESVPGTQENVPDNVIEVVKENTIDDKHNITNEVNKSKPISDLFTGDDKVLFSPAIEKSKEKPSVFSKDIDSDDELFASLPSLPKSSQKDQINTLGSNENEATVEKKETDDFDDIFKSKSPHRDTEVKKIGKLNTKNFNINVNALIPGASPKKIPKECNEQKPESPEPKTIRTIPDETDFEPKVTKNKSEKEVTNQKEQEPAKSITFDEKSDPSVLDNNLSKQRPKIQVKRRPSTRKARHEAVRKSAIDFGDDTDNSSSLDEPVPRIIKKEEKTHIKNEEIINKQDIFARGDSVDEIDRNISKETKNILNESSINPENSESLKSVPKEKDIVEATKITKEIKNTEEKLNSEEKADIFESILTNVPQKEPEASSISNETKDSTQTNKKTTKIVYILNDEDIFNTQPKLNQTKDIFSPENTKTNIETNTEAIKTLGKAYKEETEKSKEDILDRHKINKEEITKEVKSQKQSIFDDSDEELFNKNKKITKKVTIFDSDSEEDLFTGKSKEKKNKEVRNKEVKGSKEVKEVRNKEVKGSLFGDDDDDDDLFGVKKNKSEPKPQASTPSTSKETYTTATTASKTAEPVFNDPLSMLGDDD